MANNFFAETVNFFLKRGLTTFESEARDLFTFDSRKEYSMDVIMRNSQIRSVTDFALQLKDQIPGGELTNPKISSSFNIEYGLMTASQVCTMYDNPKGFGVQSIATLNGAGGTVRYRSWASSTPPYYNGFARARIQFQPDTGVSSYTLPEIMKKADITYFRADEASQRFLMEAPQLFDKAIDITGSGIATQMQLTSSIVLDAIVEEKNTLFNEDGDIISVESFDSPRHKLAIHTKYECPVLDFSGSSAINPTTGSTVRGMWHQSGVIPNYSDQGIFLEVMDIPFRERTNPQMTESLARSIGMKQEKKAIGNLATSRQVEEALVVIPYYVDNQTQTIQQFFELNDTAVKKVMRKADRPSVLTADDQLVRQVRLMKKYVFPPFLDFVTFPDEANVKQPLMYIFEFGRTLSQADLGDIWQGVLPEMGKTTQYQEAVIDLDTTYEGIEGVGPDSADIIGQNVKTLLATGDIAILNPDVKSLNDINFNQLDFFVFKIKKRAEYDYSTITKDATDDRYQFDFKATGFASTQPFFTEFGKKRLAYSYNYPYDFFSLIELAKVDAQIEMGEDEK